MAKSHVSNALGAIALSFLTLTAAGALNQAAAAGKYTWVWSSRGSAVANSTSAMSIGHMPRAIRQATEALESAQGPDRVVALHNLCIAHLERGNATAAEPSCTAALNEAPAVFAPKTERIITTNIARARSINAREQTANAE